MYLLQYKQDSNDVHVDYTKTPPFKVGEKKLLTVDPIHRMALLLFRHTTKL